MLTMLFCAALHLSDVELIDRAIAVARLRDVEPCVGFVYRADTLAGETVAAAPEFWSDRPTCDLAQRTSSGASACSSDGACHARVGELCGTKGASCTALTWSIAIHQNGDRMCHGTCGGSSDPSCSTAIPWVMCSAPAAMAPWGQR